MKQYDLVWVSWVLIPLPLSWQWIIHIVLSIENHCFNSTCIIFILQWLATWRTCIETFFALYFAKNFKYESILPSFFVNWWQAFQTDFSVWKQFRKSFIYLSFKKYLHGQIGYTYLDQFLTNQICFYLKKTCFEVTCT